MTFFFLVTLINTPNELETTGKHKTTLQRPMNLGLLPVVDSHQIKGPFSKGGKKKQKRIIKKRYPSEAASSSDGTEWGSSPLGKRALQI